MGGRLLRRAGAAVVGATVAAMALGLAPAIARGQSAEPPPPTAGTSQTFTCTGAPQTYRVAGEGIQTLYVDVRGGRGAQAENGAGGYGGSGAWVIGSIVVVGGQELTIYVGCDGQGRDGGWGHGVGGDGGHTSASTAANGGGGGGSSAIVGPEGPSPLVVAGGGGGGGGNNLAQHVRLGGDGGDGSVNGEAGAYGQFGQYNPTGMTGDNPGGCGGCLIADFNGGDGHKPEGGCGGELVYAGGGGGGGGYAGGGGGQTDCFTNSPDEAWPENNAGGGGGGSSYATDTEALFLTSFTSGQVTISTTKPSVSTYSCGSPSLVTVPHDGSVNEVVVEAVGGSGATPDSTGTGGVSGQGGMGAVVRAVVPVQPGDQFWAQAGCQGDGRDGGSGVLGNGGHGGAGNDDAGKNGGGGGGSSGIIPAAGSSVAQVVAGGGGGGGGGGGMNNGAPGSDGGAPAASPGGNSTDNHGGCAPAACGTSSNGLDGHDAATLARFAGGGGGGGAGWVGGGGGHAADPTGSSEGAGGGAGGDSYVGADAISASYGTADKPGDGLVVILMRLSRTPQNLAVHGGSGQSTAAGAGFVTPLSALVTDLSGDPVPGAQVLFTLPSSGPSATFPDGRTTTTTTSDADGIATAPPITANGALGSWDAFATLPGTSVQAVFQLRNVVVPTTARVTVSPHPVTTTEPVDVTVDVVPNQPTGTPPTGNVTVTIQGAPYVYPLVGGKAVIQLDPGDLELGSSTIQAVYPGTRGFGRSTGTAPLSVVQTATTLHLTSSPNPSAVGQGVTFTATVSVAAPNVPCASCSVDFRADGAWLGSALTDAEGVATLGPVTTLGPGTHTITATSYAGGGYLGSSASLTQQVGTTSLQVGSNQLPANHGTDLVLSAIVVATTGPDPTGTLTFREGDQVRCTTPAGPSWQACDLGDDVPLGNHTYTVTYSGDANHSGSSATFEVEVIVTRTTTTVTVPQSVPAGQEFDIDVTVARIGEGDAPLAGTVQLSLGGTPLGPPLQVAADGTASYRASIAQPDVYELTAQYSGVDDRYQPSSGSANLFITGSAAGG